MNDLYGLTEKLIKKLKQKKLTLSSAESCTGGLVASAIVDIPGASDVFMEGFVTYSNEAKMRSLGVSAGTLKLHGAVSEETAREMAAGACLAANTDAAVSTTGIAGPGGGTKLKPVGLVYIACALNGSIDVKELHLKGSRTEIRNAAAYEALSLLANKLN